MVFRKGKRILKFPLEQVYELSRACWTVPSLNEKGKKTSVVIDIRDYNNLLDNIEDLEDAHDFLKAEHEATGFIPYETFRKKLLKGKRY